MLNLLKRLVKKKEGQGIVEYGLVILLVSIATLAVLAALGVGANNMFKYIADSINPLPSP